MPNPTKFAIALLASALVASCTFLIQEQSKTQPLPEPTPPETVLPTVTEPSTAIDPSEVDEPPVPIQIEPTKSEPEAAPEREPVLIDEAIEANQIVESAQNMAIELCHQIGNKLASVDVDECLSQELLHSALSVEQRSLAYRDFAPIPNRDPLGRVMVIGGIHGDEFSSVSVVFKWMNILQEHHSGLFHWRFIPSANPDGLLQKKSQRQNLPGVDLNRNFPTQDWPSLALSYWQDKTHSNVRRYPGPSANSEPETQWLVQQIDEFDPDIIISMHAPYHLVDYDGPPSAPNQLGGLYLRQLGVYPGSLGNYIGVDQKKPIVTVELKSAGIMPDEREIDRMWTDLIRWLRLQLD